MLMFLIFIKNVKTQQELFIKLRFFHIFLFLLNNLYYIFNDGDISFNGKIIMYFRQEKKIQRSEKDSAPLDVHRDFGATGVLRVDRPRNPNSEHNNYSETNNLRITRRSPITGSSATTRRFLVFFSCTFGFSVFWVFLRGSANPRVPEDLRVAKKTITTVRRKRSKRKLPENPNEPINPYVPS